MIWVFDTDVLIDYLSGSEKARRLLLDHDTSVISIITWIEIMSGARDSDRRSRFAAFLDGFSLVQLSPEIASRTAALRQARRRLKLPDAVIYATAEELGVQLVTRNTRDFSAADPRILVPYTL